MIDTGRASFMPYLRVLATLVCLFVPCGLHAQVDTTRRDTVQARLAADTVVTVPPLMQRTPPVSPLKAFLQSLVLPGLGQTRLDRPSTGALFATVELGALAMIRRTSQQLSEARRFFNDSLPTDFGVDAEGNVVPVGVSSGGFSRELLRRRRLHREDWIAVMAFNHLLAGADAFVSAQLWDLPTAVSIVPTPSGRVAALVSIQW